MRKITLITLLLCASTTAVQAQWGSHVWCVGDNGNVYAYGHDGVQTTVRTGIGTLPAAIATAEDGSVYVAMAGSSQIYRTNASGTIQTAYAAGSSPTDLAFDVNGDFWITQANNAVLQLASDGTILQTITPSAVTTVIALASTAQSHLWLADGASTLYQYTVAGSLVRSITTGSTSVADVIGDRAGFCWVADTTGGSVVKYDPTNGGQATSINVTGPNQLVVNSFNEIYVLSTNAIQYYTSLGSPITSVALSGGPYRGLALDGNGDVWTATGNQLLKYDRWTLSPLGTVTVQSATTVRVTGDASGWIIANALKPNDDSDNDQVANVVEVTAGSNPFESGSTPTNPQPIVSGPPRVGQSFKITFRNYNDALLGFACGGAMGFSNPIPIPNDNRTIPLDNDPFYSFVLGNFWIFQSFGGFLDANGDAFGQVNIPNDAQLVGTTWYFAYVTLDNANAQSNQTPIETVSNNVSVTVQP